MDALLRSFQGTAVLVVGDVMVDSYLKGFVAGISPEAPVPVVKMKERENRLGGAANVALNIKKLGGDPILCSVVGDDGWKGLLEEELHRQDITGSFLVEEKNRKTTLKYRVIGNQSQLLRVDDEETGAILPENGIRLAGFVRDMISRQRVDALIFVDYDKGVLTPSLIEDLSDLCHARGIPIAVDPKRENFRHYQNVGLFKPNRKEFQEGIGITGYDLSIPELEEEMRKFASSQGIDYLMVTLSEEGVALYQRSENLFIHQPAYQREIRDVSGAGDTVAAVATMALKHQATPFMMAHLANLGGGVVCEHAGVVPITAKMLAAEYARREQCGNI